MVRIGMGVTEGDSTSYDAIDLEESNSRDYSIDSDGDDEDSSDLFNDGVEMDQHSIRGEDEEVVSEHERKKMKCEGKQRSSRQNIQESDDEEELIEASPEKELRRNLVSSITASAATKPSNPVKSSTPPAAAFKKPQKTHRLPSYGIAGVRSKSSKYGGRDKRGTHQRLAADEKDAKDLLLGDERKRKGRKRFMRNPIGPTRARDPAQFPLEQYTDTEYGITDGPHSISYSFASPDVVQNTLNRKETDVESEVNYSYASSDPSNINYEPQRLRKMKVKVDGDDEAWRRKIICTGILTAFILSLVISILVIVTRIEWPFVKAPPENLDEICSITNILTEDGHKKCERVCESARCCSAPGDESCFLDNEKMCSLVSD